MRLMFYFLLFTGFSSVLSARADDAAKSGAISFRRDIAPILTNQCQPCHGPNKAKGKYRVDTFARLSTIGAGDDQPIIAGKPAQSGIYKRLISTDEDERMPQKADPLPKAQIDLIRQWIQQGAKFDAPDPSAALSSLIVSPPHPLPPIKYLSPLAVTALAFSPDGTILAACGYNEVTLWDVADHHLRGRITDIPQQVLSLDFSSDGKHLAVAGGTPGTSGELRLVNMIGAGDGKVLNRISDVMTVARFSPDGTRLAAGGADNIIRIYDAASGQGLRTIEQHADWVMDLAFSRDGKQLVSASRDKSCRVFDVESGQMRSACNDSENPVFAVAQEPDGKTIYSAGRDGKVLCWNAADGKKQAEIPLPLDVFGLRITGGALVAACADGSLRYIATGNKHQSIREEHLFNDWSYTLTLSRDGKLIAAGSHDGTVCILNAADGKELSRFIATPGFERTQMRR